MIRYTEEHEWLDEEDGVVTVGITEHAAEQLGDVVFVELPEPEKTVAKGDQIATIESVKAASDILAPFDGEILEVNEAIVENPALVNEDPLGDAWFVRIRPVNAADLEEYLDEAEYKKLTE